MKNHRVVVQEAIVVEGRFDKNTLSQYVNARIIETGGFQVFSRADLIHLIRRLAEKCGVILLTDSDSAGFLIRNHLKGMIHQGIVRHAYIPEIPGKERRKHAASKEGKLGVEAMSKEVLLDALRKAGATMDDTAPNHQTEKEKKLTTASLYAFGLSGQQGSGARRKRLLKQLALPEHLSTSAFLDVLNALYNYDELFKLLNSQVFDAD